MSLVFPDGTFRPTRCPVCNCFHAKAKLCATRKVKPGFTYDRSWPRKSE